MAAVWLAVTITWQIAILSLLEWASIDAFPGATPVTLPLASTVATDGLELDQVTVLSVAFSGRTVAVTVNESPTPIVILSLSTVIPVGSIVAALTVTEQVADFPPAAAVMVAEPAATAVTFPSLTVATFASEVDQVTVLSVASEGATVAVNVTVPPISSVTELWLRVTPVTATVVLPPPPPPPGVGLKGSSLGVQPKKNREANARA